MSRIKTFIGKAALGAVVSCAVLLGAMAPAQAKTYGGSFTPPFGGAFPDLEWSGSGTFFIPDTCEALPTGWYANSGPTCGGMTITNGQLVFESIGNLHADEVFNFGTASVVNMYVDGGSLHGVESTFIGGFTSAYYNTVGVTPVWFWLKFEKQIAVGPNLSVVQLYYNAVGEGPDCIVRHDCSIFGESESTAILHLTPIPEPQTVAMMIAGLLGVGAVVRRRRQR